MRLTELNPKWVGIAAARHTMLHDIMFGVRFDCPHCRTTRLVALFDPIIDPGEWAWKIAWGMPDLAQLRWSRTGETFDTLTLSPSYDAGFDGHWHGFITNGEIR